MKKKVIIALVGTRNAGKTAAIRKLVEIFPFSSEPEYLSGKLNECYDISVVGQYNSPNGEVKTIGICSFGDYICDGLDKEFRPLATIYHCDVIVVPCHNYQDKEGNTYRYIDDTAKEHGYKLLTTSIIRDESIPYVTIDEWKLKGGSEIVVNGVSLNEIFAQNMINLIKSLL
ncbi:MAG: hypothetical protein J6X70_02690 [Muribaculaceae bacterium]|nr:hypothetical protein [Muribaculaceae bacterium]